MRFTVDIAPSTAAKDAWTDLVLTFTLANDRGAVEVYLDGALSPARCGWVGPTLGVPESHELRTWYGPPGHPPATKYFEQSAKTLKKGATLVAQRCACVVPRATVDPAAFAPATIDPDAMDGLAALNLPAVYALLVLDTTAQMLRVEQAKRADWLRPSVIVPLRTAGRHELRWTYSQQANGFFKPKTSFTATAATELIV